MFSIFLKHLKTSRKTGLYRNHKTADLQDLIYTTIGVDININTNKFYSYIPLLKPYQELQRKFKTSIKKYFTVTIDSWISDTKTITRGLDYQRSMGSS